MRKCAFQVLSFALLLVAGTLNAQNLASTWQGTFKSDSDDHRLVLRIAKSETGSWKATALYIEFLHDDPYVDSLLVNGSDLRITIDGGKGEYHGTINSNGSAITGTWTFDHRSMPLELRRATSGTAWHTPFQYQYHLKDVTYARPSPAEATIPFSPKLAVDYMEQGALAWTAEWKCVACHTNGSYMVVRPLLTPQLGQPQKELRDFFVATLQGELATDPEDQRPELDSTQAVYVAAALAIWDAHVTHRLSPETAQALSMMFKMQRAVGDWTISDDNNPPLESNRYQLATVAARAIGNAPGWLGQQRGTPV